MEKIIIYEEEMVGFAKAIENSKYEIVKTIKINGARIIFLK